MAMDENLPYAKGALMFSLIAVAVLTFAGLYFDVRITLISLPLLVFLAVIFIGWSANRCLNKGEMRRAIAATLVATFIVLVLGSDYITVPSELRNYLLGVLSTIIGFYFGYRGRETEEERMERIIRGLGVNIPGNEKEG
ncbi:hypothetical protein [Thermococcus sp. 21S7]|uniref:hypothetical protein n=1 Tax=Thermococcus sp. 21S7 TaxID=1638221 RepID=UPI0014387949|nr:hypothetical protein [Thermococcus sp. 21S7]NJE60646.1 hypothetical protein [Thermococcus sp. 21S7]